MDPDGAERAIGVICAYLRWTTIRQSPHGTVVRCERLARNRIAGWTDARRVPHVRLPMLERLE